MIVSRASVRVSLTTVVAAAVLTACAPLSESLRLVELPYRVVPANAEASSPAPPEATSKGGRAFRMLRQRDDGGEIAPDAMSHALRQREALVQLVPKVGGVMRNAWTALGPSTTLGGRVKTIHIDPTDPHLLLAGAATGGIWHSEDAGASWLPVNDFLGSLAISSLAHDAGNPSVIYAGTSEYYYTATQGIGILKSIDDGRSWQRLPATDPVASNNWTYVMRVAAHPTTPGVVLAGTWTGALRSADSGATWTKVFSRVAFDGRFTIVLDVRFNPVDPNQVLLGLEDSAVAYSDDAGFTWTKVQIAPAVNKRRTGRVELAFARTVSGLAYASVVRNGGEVWKSSDAGHTWTLASTPGHLYGDNSVNAIWVDPVNAQHVIVGGVDLWRSVDGGQTFLQISDWQRWPTSAHADQHALVAEPGYDGTTNARIYVAGDGGVYRANNILATTTTSGWTNLNNGLNAVQFWGGAASPTAGGLFVGGTQDNGTLTLQRAGNQWFRWFGGDGGSTAIDPTDPTLWYGELAYAAAFRSLDGGANANYICAGISDAYSASATFAPCGLGTSGEANFIAPTVLDPNQPGRLLVGANSLWVPEDARVPTPTWHPIKAPSTGVTASGGGNWISAIAVQPGDSNVVWIGHNNGELYVSIDALSVSPTWRAVTGLPARFVSRIVFDPANANRVYVAFGGFTAGNLYVTDNGGTSWTGVGAALPAAPILALAIGRHNSQFLYAGTEVGLFATEDGGQSWSASNDGPANVPVEELSWLDDNTIIAATHGRGAFLALTDGSGPVDAVEYYYSAWNFYFETAFPDEIAALDGGAFGGAWQRTGQTFKVWPQATGSASATCRFFSTAFAPKSSHFYTPFANECAIVKTESAWQYEAIAFYIQLADANGLCPPGTIPLYRLYNNGMGGAPNHRYTTSVTVFNQMIAQGWLFEGNGNTKVFACVPQ